MKLMRPGLIALGMFTLTHCALFSADAQDITTDIKTLPDFKAEPIYVVPKTTQGSWVSLCVDNKGRIIASDQNKAGLFRVTLAALDAADPTPKVEKIPVDLSSAQGMLYAFDSLYVHVNGNDTYPSGLYRVRDTDGDDQFDKVEMLMPIDGAGEHGPHNIVLSPDGQSLFVNAGNHTHLPQISGGRLDTDWQEDLLLPRQWDARGHAKGVMAPGGWICKVDPDGKNWEVFSVGYRNEWDIAFNRDGELFAYDSDMEWDMGMPWYRPTRVNHATSGSNFGWRSGSGKSPVYYEDTLPAVVDIGPGSPTGITFGYGLKFPTKLQDALFMNDWTFGTIHVVHLTPEGSTYTGVEEEFLSGVPLPVTDVVVGADGALYFATGGRGLQSALYRVTYHGSESTAEPRDPGFFDLGARNARRARAQRRDLEAFHGRVDPDAVNSAWKYLDDDDRFIRYAARLAVEAQPVDEWREKALRERGDLATVNAMIALARHGGPQDQEPIFNRLLRVGMRNDEVALAATRAWQLAFIRLGPPTPEYREMILEKLDGLYPSKSTDLNRELVQLLVYLDAPLVVDRTLDLIANPAAEPLPDWAELITRNQSYGSPIRAMLDSPPPSTGIHYAFALRNVRYGWTLDQREAYFNFLTEAAKHPGGASYEGFIKNIREEALANCSESEKRTLMAKFTGESISTEPDFAVTPPKGPGQQWTVDSAAAAIGDKLRGRNFENGRNVFYAIGCIKCHRFDGAGGAIGPDLTSVGNKFSIRDLMETIVEPSKVISDQYASSNVTMKNGDVHSGLVIDHNESDPFGDIEIFTSDYNAPPVKVNKGGVVSIDPSKVSQMPEELLWSLNEIELKDLTAYLLSRGNPEDEVFK